MLASETLPITLDVPGRPGQRVTIRRLGWKALAEAKDAVTSRAVEWMRTHDAADLQREIEQHGGIEGIAAESARSAVHNYDFATLIEKSVTSWAPPMAPPQEGDPLQEWLAREIVALSERREPR